MQEDVLLTLLDRVPRESLELLSRNVKIRKNLETLYEMHRSGMEMRYNGEFEKIFNEIFRFFFRPIEIAIISAKQLRFFLPTRDNMELFESFAETFQAYEDFLLSLRSHIDLMRRITSESNPAFMQVAEEIARIFGKEADKILESTEIDGIKFVSDYPFLLSNRALRHIMKAFDCWEMFSRDYYVFKDLMKSTYITAVNEFVDIANSIQFESYTEFANTFYDKSAEHFDRLLKSKEYLDVQNSMTANLMDHFYHLRAFFEEFYENNIFNPFATISQIDEAYRRITDLRRKIDELESRIEKLETKKEKLRGGGRNDFGKGYRGS